MEGRTGPAFLGRISLNLQISPDGAASWPCVVQEGPRPTASSQVTCCGRWVLDGYLINVARGSVVDEQALAKAVSDGAVAGAGLDVFEDEPHPHPALLRSPRVTLLPHIGSATYETRRKMAMTMVDALETALRNAPTDDFRARP